MFLDSKNIPEDFPLGRLDHLIIAVDSLLDRGAVPSYLSDEILWCLEGLFEGHTLIEHVIANADDAVKELFVNAYIEVINKEKLEKEGNVSQKNEVEIELVKYENNKKWRTNHINNMKRFIDGGELAETEVEKMILLSVSLEQAASIKGVSLYSYQYFLSAMIGRMELVSKLKKVMTNGKIKAVTDLTREQLELVDKYFKDGQIVNS
ncbi:hypothetical protein [Bacillus sp. Brlt_9]|uniref:hypothetical protein n=1 Tax=Bacillus sp. Brlt_9 TaxID=3110916 RepID=UPI003F7BCC56